MSDDRVPSVNISEFQLGTVWARMNGVDQRFDAMERRAEETQRQNAQQFALLHTEIKNTNETFKQALDAQTETLKPLFRQQAAVDAVQEAGRIKSDHQKEKSELRTNFMVRAGVLIAICSTLFGGIDYALKAYVHPAETNVTITHVDPNLGQGNPSEPAAQVPPNPY
jgi:hypothetical protein